MAANVMHYFKNGTKYSGKTHKMNGQIHSGATHSKSSKQVFHYKDLSAAAKKKVKK
jgi:hypothetical protein